MRASFVGSVLLLAGLLGCEEIQKFDNSDGSAYCGPIVAGNLVRSEFSVQAQLQLTLDASELSSRPGTLTSSDGVENACGDKPLFDQAELRVSQKLAADALSTLEFEAGQLRNLVAWVDSECNGAYLAVLSLMENGQVEVRLMNGKVSADQGGAFGVFRLRRSAGGCGYD